MMLEKIMLGEKWNGVGPVRLETGYKCTRTREPK